MAIKGPYRDIEMHNFFGSLTRIIHCAAKGQCRTFQTSLFLFIAVEIEVIHCSSLHIYKYLLS